MCRPHLSPDVQTPFNPHDNTGTGWTFDFADGGAFRGAVHNALQTYRWTLSYQLLLRVSSSASAVSFQ